MQLFPAEPVQIKSKSLASNFMLAFQWKTQGWMLLTADCHSYTTCERTISVFNSVFCSLHMNPFNAVCLVLNQGNEGKSLAAFWHTTAESAAGTPHFQLDCLEMTRDRVTYHEARSSAWEDTKTHRKHLGSISESKHFQSRFGQKQVFWHFCLNVKPEIS